MNVFFTVNAISSSTPVPPKFFKPQQFQIEPEVKVVEEKEKEVEIIQQPVPEVKPVTHKQLELRPIQKAPERNPFLMQILKPIASRGKKIWTMGNTNVSKNLVTDSPVRINFLWDLSLLTIMSTKDDDLIDKLQETIAACSAKSIKRKYFFKYYIFYIILDVCKSFNYYYMGSIWITCE
jgi:hypothetical protein